ncbi:PKD domain-containing protein [Aeromicrobium stalagmiti]|uniref:PKD domain-containing protein n=1 Tax=Aeromicrobium stalagmiti TaxID=2738988 RepID=UPI001C2CBEE1|nr:PKD domain-containing protein [Aeromicrobium stalagmiti]
MRSTTRRRTALLASLAFAATSLGLTSSPVEAAECTEGPSCVIVNVVRTVDGDTTTLYSEEVSTAEIAEWSDFDESRQYYKRRNVTGTVSEGPRVGKNTGISLYELLERVNALHPDKAKAATFSETPNARKIPSVLSDADLVDPADPGKDGYPFDDSLAPAVYVSGSRIGYVRPLRDADKDVNITDIFKVSGALELTFHTTGKLLEPVVSVGSTSVDTKAKSAFSITYAKKPGTRIIKTRWDFGDGSTKGTKRDEPTKTYAKKGTYPVSVTVYGANGSYGRSAPVEMKVDNPPKAPSSGTGGGTGTGGLGSTGGYVPPYDPGTIDPPSDDPPAEDVPDDEPTDDIPVDDGLEEVEGYVLAGAEIVPGGTPEAIPGTQDSSQPAPATQEALRKRIATWIVAALAIALLVGAGAASETRWFRTRLHHLRRRA